MANANNITLGSFDTTYFNGAELGYSENVSVTVNPSFARLEAGRPKELVRKTVVDFEMEASANVKEITPQNWLLAMGIDDNVFTSSAAADVDTYWKSFTTYITSTAYSASVYVEPTSLTGYLYQADANGGTSDVTEPSWPTAVGATVSDNNIVWTCIAYGGEAVTMASYFSGSLDVADLTGYNLDTTNVPKVFNTDYTTKYTANSDYMVDSLRGLIFRNPGGTMTLNQAIKVVYQYAPYNYEQINYNASSFVNYQSDAKVKHTMVGSADVIEYFFPKVQGKGAECAFHDDNFADLPVSWTIMKDEQRDNLGFGRMKIKTA